MCGADSKGKDPLVFLIIFCCFCRFSNAGEMKHTIQLTKRFSPI